MGFGLGVGFWFSGFLLGGVLVVDGACYVWFCVSGIDSGSFLAFRAYGLV